MEFFHHISKIPRIWVKSIFAYFVRKLKYLLVSYSIRFENTFILILPYMNLKFRIDQHDYTSVFNDFLEILGTITQKTQFCNKSKESEHEYK